MADTCPRWFGRLWRKLAEVLLRREDQMVGRGVGRLGKSIGKTITDLGVNRMLWLHLILVSCNQPRIVTSKKWLGCCLFTFHMQMLLTLTFDSAENAFLTHCREGG